MYQVKILTNDEFEKAAASNPRYKHVDEDNLGFADPVENTAYVRLTAFPDLNKYLINHEFEHLLEDHGTDEDDMGIRHKKKRGFMDWFTGLSTAGLWHPSSDATAAENKERDTAFNAEKQAENQQRSLMDMFGSSNKSLGEFSTQGPSSSQIPSNLSGENAGGQLYSGGINQSQKPQDQQMIERLKGFFSGRPVSF
jgi:hypothetical protein